MPLIGGITIPFFDASNYPEPKERRGSAKQFALRRYKVGRGAAARGMDSRPVCPLIKIQPVEAFPRKWQGSREPDTIDRAAQSVD